MPPRGSIQCTSRRWWRISFTKTGGDDEHPPTMRRDSAEPIRSAVSGSRTRLAARLAVASRCAEASEPTSDALTSAPISQLQIGTKHAPSWSMVRRASSTEESGTLMVNQPAPAS